MGFKRRKHRVNEHLEIKIKEHLKTGKGVFLGVERVVVALCYPKELGGLIPEQYRQDPLRAYFNVLDDAQRAIVQEHYQGGDNGIK